MRRRSLPKPDPAHVAKRKAFLANQFIFNGNHASIKKTITWDDFSDAAKQARTSTSQTPGLSDKSYTPTPAARPLPSALKSSSSRNTLTGGSQSRLLPHPKKEVVLLPPNTQPSTPGPSVKPTPKLPKKSTPAPRRTNLASDSIPSGSHGLDNTKATPPSINLEPPSPENEESASDKPPVPTADPADEVIGTPPRPLFNPESDDDRDANPDNDAWLARPSVDPRASSPLSSPDLGAAAPPSPGLDESAPAPEPLPPPRSAESPAPPSIITIPSTSSNMRTSTAPTPGTPSPPPKGGPVRPKRRRSSVGIQTIPERDVDWLGDMKIDESMSAIDVSRVWAGASSPVKGQGPASRGNAAPEEEEDDDEPMGVSFLQEFEGQQYKGEVESEQPARAESIGPFSDADEGVGKGIMTDGTSTNDALMPGPEQNENAGRDSSSPEPLPPPEQPQSARSSPDPISFGHYAEMTEDVPQFTNDAVAHLDVAHLDVATTSKTQGDHVAARVSALQASVSQPINPQAAPYPFNLRTEADPKPTSASQPLRARSRMYTPMPTPGQPLRAAPTLGRSMYEDLGAEKDNTESRKETEERNALRAAPTLGRSMVWEPSTGKSDADKTKVTKTPQIILLDDVEDENPFQDADPSQPLPSTPSPPHQSARKSGKTSTSTGLRLTSYSQPQPLKSRPRLSSEGQVVPSASQPQAPSSPLSDAPPPKESPVAGPSTRYNRDAQVDNTQAIYNDDHESQEDEEQEEPRATPVPEPESESEYVPAELPIIKSRSQSTKSRGDSVKAKSAAATDYDAEYGSVPDVPSAVSEPESREPTHIMISSSPTNPGAWTLEPNHASTPQFQAKLPPSIVPELHIGSPPRPPKEPQFRRPGLASSPNRPKSLAALGKRRRESVTPSGSQTSPFPPSKKIRREYDTIESGAVPRDTRAHEDKFDEHGNRIWVPPRPTMQRAPEGSGGVKKITVPIQKRVVSEDSGSEQEDKVDHGKGVALEAIAEREDVTMENDMAQDVQEIEQNEVPIEDDFTEIPETPQVGPIRNFEAFLEPEMPIAGPSRISFDEAPALAIEPLTPAVIQPAPPASVVPSREQSRASPFTSFASKHSRVSRSKRKSEQSGLQFTPAPRASRTRLSLGGRSGPMVEQASERDARILQEAGLKPTLKRLSQAHGFTPEVVADVYQEHGDLKETEEALKEMKRSASRTRAKIARRTSMRDSMVAADTFTSRGQGGGSDSSDDEQVGDVLSGLDASRTTRDILFGTKR